MPANDEDDLQWGDEDAVPLLGKAKVASLKVLCRRCLTHSETENAIHIAKPVLNMLFTVVDNGGSIREEQPEEYALLYPLCDPCSLLRAIESKYSHDYAFEQLLHY